MLPRLRTRPIPFPELSYANAAQAPIKRWVIRSIEGVPADELHFLSYPDDPADTPGVPAELPQVAV